AELTPRVEVVRPGLCALPARGPARFHGGEEALRVHAQDTVVEAGYDCGAGVADGLFAAELAARAGEGGLVVPEGEAAAFLAPYPLSVLDRPELAGLLHRLGVKTLGDFAALPPGHVAARFGADGALAHRLARGEEPRPLAPVRGAPDLSVRTAFDPPAERSERVVFGAKRLAGELHEGLAAGGLACGRVGSRTCAPGAGSRARSHQSGAPPTCRCAPRSPRPPSGPSGSCSARSGWRASCTRGSRRAGWPACGWRSRSGSPTGTCCGGCG